MSSFLSSSSDGSGSHAASTSRGASTGRHSDMPDRWIPMLSVKTQRRERERYERGRNEGSHRADHFIY